LNKRLRVSGGYKLDDSDHKEVLRFARTPALPGVELMTARGSPHAWRVYHEQYAVCTVDKATADIRYRRNLHQIANRSTLLFEPGETHLTQPVTVPQDFQVLFFTPESMQQYSDEMEMPGRLHFKPDCNIDEQLLLSCKRLHAAILEDAAAIEQQSLLADCIGTLFSSHAERRGQTMLGAEKLPLLRARDFLIDRYAHTLSLDEIAAIAGLSRFHFLKAFTAQFGLPPHSYQIHLRIERSLPLLRQGVCLSHVAEAIGFNDQSHFIRHFKRIMRVTPGRYKGLMPVSRRSL